MRRVPAPGLLVALTILLAGLDGEDRTDPGAPRLALAQEREAGVRTAQAPAPPPPAASPAPADVVIRPGDDAVARVAAAPEGARIRFAAGLHRLDASLRPRSRQVLFGDLGPGGERLSVLSGSRLVTGWTRDGARWVSTGASEKGQIHASCRRSHPRCGHPNDLFADGQWLFHKADADVGPGQFHHDRAASLLYVGDDPTGKRMEFGRTRHAVEGSGVDVAIRDLVIEQFAQPAQHGAIHPGPGASGWTVTNVEARLNHAHAIALPPRAIVSRAFFHDNGQMGFGCARCDGAVVQDSEISHNNRAGHDAGWEAGGTKIAYANDVIIRRNHVHHNGGPGIWFDIDNGTALVEDNHVHDHHSAAGIFYEISYGPVLIRRNRIERQTGGPGWCYGAAILISASGRAEIAENTITESGRGISLISQRRGAGSRGPYLVQDVWVHHNTVDGQTQLAQACQDWGDQGLYTRNNRFEANTYRHRGRVTGTPFGWGDAARDWAGWQAQGQDRGGAYTRLP
jgi:hypothetical protein